MDNTAVTYRKVMEPLSPAAERVRFAAALADMRQLVAELELAIHKGRPTESIWSRLAHCNAVLTYKA